MNSCPTFLYLYLNISLIFFRLNIKQKTQDKFVCLDFDINSKRTGRFVLVELLQLLYKRLVGDVVNKYNVFRQVCYLSDMFPNMRNYNSWRYNKTGISPMQPPSYEIPTPPPPRLSRQFLKNLYQSRCTSAPTQTQTPVLQILGFEQTLHEPHSQIIIRLSDSVVFVDCSLIGPYCIRNNKIVSIDASQQFQGHGYSYSHGQGQTHVEFNVRDLVKLTDYFSKIDTRRICQLRIMIIRMELAGRLGMRVGYPEELSQYFQNMKEGGKDNKEANMVMNSDQIAVNSIQHPPAPLLIKPNPGSFIKQIIKIEDEPQQKQNKPPKLESQNKNPTNLPSQPQSQSQSQSSLPSPSPSNNNNGNNTIVKKLDRQDPLTYQEIIEGKEGFFLGRLLRIKMANKETKEGPMSVLYLGFIDRVGELVRINMAGRLAMKQQKQLKKGKCYYIKDLQVYRNEKLSHPQLRLKDKQYKIIEAVQPSITQKYAKSYYHWQHENQSPEIDNVDIIGIVDEISEKKVYNSGAKDEKDKEKEKEKEKEKDKDKDNQKEKEKEKREVVRVTVRNRFKSVQINFWAEQIRALSLVKLKRKQPVVFQDIKKKKNIFLDFQHESSIIKLDQCPTLKQQLKHLLPQSSDSCPTQPKNLHELSLLPESEQAPTKPRTFRLHLIKMQQNRVIYKLCTYCRRKVERSGELCGECSGAEFYYKFNCHLEFGDYTGTICCVAFQFSAQKMLGKNAGEINQMTEQQLKQLIEQHMFKQYEVGIENRESRFIVRNIQPVESTKQLIKISKENLDQIYRKLEERKKKRE